MIEISDKSKCCGCSACVTACPVNCITFDEDDQGFRYPKVNISSCINCHLCEKVCPFLNDGSDKTPINVYEAKNPNYEVRINSSSGGIFSIIAESIILNKGVVFGACFNEKWEVIHNHAKTVNDLDAFRRSKYVQSFIGLAFKDAKSYLDSGCPVLFSGTPCQIEGLKRYLRKEYDNLYTLEVVCHAVPSPKIWRHYLNSVIQLNAISLDEISFINFRNKKFGWKEFSLLIKSGDEILVQEKCSANLYLQGFINNLYIRPSCLNCPSKNGKSGSDFSLADFWAINQYIPSRNDNKGSTLIYVNSMKGKNLIDTLPIEKSELKFSQNLNIAYSHSTKEKYPIQKFWNLYSKQGLDAIEVICRNMRPNPLIYFIRRCMSFVKRKLS